MRPVSFRLRSRPAAKVAGAATAARPIDSWVVAILALAGAGLAIWSALLQTSRIGWQEKIEAVQREVAERQALETAVSRDPTDALARVRWGIYLGQRGLNDAAEVQLTTAYALAPEDPLVAFSLGKFYLHVGNNRRALPPLEQAAARAPRNAEARLHLGLAYLNLDQPQAARTEFEAAAGLNPSLPEAHLGLAMVYSDRATAQRALAEIEAYIRLAKNPATGRVLLSRSYYSLLQIPRAIEAARNAVREQPDSLLAWQALGLALAEGSLPERDEAGRCFAKAIDVAPRFADAHIGLARVYLRQKKHADAVREFEIALSLDPTAGYVQYELGQAYQGAGQRREAEEQFRAAAAYMAYKRQVVAARRAIVRDPTNPSRYVALAKLYTAHGAYDWGVSALERALRLKPGDAALRRELRLAQEMARD
jgi:Tfp pilus assembly protein PilF